MTPDEPWCRECGVYVADKDVHDRWHDRLAGRTPEADDTVIRVTNVMEQNT